MLILHCDHCEAMLGEGLIVIYQLYADQIKGISFEEFSTALMERVEALGEEEGLGAVALRAFVRTRNVPAYCSDSCREAVGGPVQTTPLPADTPEERWEKAENVVKMISSTSKMVPEFTSRVKRNLQKLGHELADCCGGDHDRIMKALGNIDRKGWLYHALHLSIYEKE